MINFLEIEKSQSTKEEFVMKVKPLIDTLPPENKILLSCLMGLLAKVCSRSAVNKMNSSNLAIVFSPTLLRSKEETMMSAITDSQFTNLFVQHLIDYYPQIVSIPSLLIPSPEQPKLSIDGI